MDLDLKSSLVNKLQAIAPEYGLLELSYPSFMRCYGYRSQPLSAADAVEAIGALLDVAGGVKMEVEVEGNRGGGEWFGGGRVWEIGGPKDKIKQRDGKAPTNDADGEVGEKLELPWWIHNFWTAYDALTEYVLLTSALLRSRSYARKTSITPLRAALNLSMSLHRAIIRQGTSIIDHHSIRTMRSHRVVVLTQGPDLALFAHPGVLSRLALWLVEALRDRLPGTVIGGARKKGKKSLPLVVACLREDAGTYIVVGVVAALDFGEVRKKWVPPDIHLPNDRLTQTLLTASSVLRSSTRRNAVMPVRDTGRSIRASWRSTRQT
jgi:cell division control protein 45